MALVLPGKSSVRTPFVLGKRNTAISGIADKSRQRAEEAGSSAIKVFFAAAAAIKLLYEVLLAGVLLLGRFIAVNRIGLNTRYLSRQNDDLRAAQHCSAGLIIVLVVTKPRRELAVA